MEKSRNERVKEYDLIRGIAILFVIFGHSYQLGSSNLSMGEYISADTNNVVTIFNGVVNQIVYSFHMPLYMILSGALAYNSLKKAKPGEYIKSRFKRLMIPFLLCGLFFSVPLKFVAGYYGVWSLPKAYLYSLILMQTTGHLWFLFILYVLDVLFVLAYDKKVADNHFFVVLLVIMFLVHDYLPGGGFLLFKFGQFALYFYIGLLFEQMEIRKKLCQLPFKKKYLLLLLCVITYFLAFGFEQYFNTTIPIGKAIVRNMFEFFEAISATLLIFLICHFRVEKEHKVIKWLSDRSFGIYLYHEPIIILCISIFVNTEIINLFVSEIGYLMSIVIRYIMALIGSLFVDYIVRNIISPLCLKRGIKL